MERVVARETPADHRCPYCHDALASGEALPADDLVECDGCRTRHHRACIEELGRCTIRGCERSLHVAPPTALDQPIPAAELRSAVRREVERRLRERARTFVQNNARPVSEAGGRAEVEAVFAAAREAEREDDLDLAATRWHELARLLVLVRPEELRGLELENAARRFALPSHAAAQDTALAAEWAVDTAKSLAGRANALRVRKALGVVCLTLLGLVVASVIVVTLCGLARLDDDVAPFLLAPLLVLGAGYGLYALLRALR